MFSVETYLRQLFSVVLCVILAWDVFRVSEMYIPHEMEIVTWTMLMNFIYFQLPLKSRALAFFHPLAFSTSIVSPVSYIFLLYCNPRFEYARLDDWGLTFNAVVIRSCLVYGVPIILQAIDIGTIQGLLITAYQNKIRQVQIAWTMSAYFVIDMLHAFIYPDRYNKINLGISDTSAWHLFTVKIATASLAFFLLYLFILRYAYGRQVGTTTGRIRTSGRRRSRSRTSSDASDKSE
jgi:hypothetical protein